MCRTMHSVDAPTTWLAVDRHLGLLIRAITDHITWLTFCFHGRCDAGAGVQLGLRPALDASSFSNPTLLLKVCNWLHLPRVFLCVGTGIADSFKRNQVLSILGMEAPTPKVDSKTPMLRQEVVILICVDPRTGILED